MKCIDTQVIVVGAGPTGLMAANQLQRFGIDYRIIDSKSGPTKESRAIAVTARSLEIYQQMGLSDEVVNNGQRILEAQVISQGKAKATINIGELGKGLSDFSYLLAYEQNKNETLLAAQLKQDILWQHKFIKLNEYENNISSLIHDLQKDEQLEIKAKYLIACDGASSLVRHQLNFSFEGGTYDHKFFVVDTRFDWPEAQHRVMIAPGEDNFCAFLPLKGSNSFRIVGTLPAQLSESDSIVFDDLKQVINNTIGRNINYTQVNWFSIYKLHHRMVDKFKKGNVFLAGDAAHIHSPAGGQGMNTGLQDAYNLVWKLALVLKGQADSSLLETYNEERLPFARFLLRFTDQGFTRATSQDFLSCSIRKYLLPILAPQFGLIAGSKPFLFKTVSQTAWTYKDSSLSRKFSKQRLKFKAGDRVPYFAEQSIYPLLNKASHHMICISDSVASEAQKKKIIDAYAFPIEWIDQPMDEKWKKLGVKRPLLILVRPDNYIQSISDL